ncbi:MAG: aminodeoxychorismate/anthranilate synthase component II [Myxococcales bacterium]|nr:aminodeoxychorismate/anthranilate synthase component II [Myxococcota bacterium]MDW8280977.1 aminodeoxychorismate/anthranilate synthase component II [Myxococcales bacterium]
MLLLIDNYDSFTHNLAQYLGELGAEVVVLRNDEIDVAGILALAPERLVLSPGPGGPEEAGVCLTALRELPRLRPQLPVLGVCLGHQALARAFGARVVRGRPVHGKTWPVYIDATLDDPLLRGLPSPFLATRYHSLVVEPCSLPPSLLPTAWTAEGDIMALRHSQLPLFGVQFHPESIGTPCGRQLLSNFLRIGQTASAE